MTGRRAGYCAGYQVPGFTNDRGFRGGRGRGGGFGHRHWYHATGLTGWQRDAMAWPTGVDVADIPPGTAHLREQNVEALEKQAAIAEQTLKELKKRIQEIKSSTNE